MRKFEHVAQEGAIGVGLRAVDDRMRTDDHGNGQPPNETQDQRPRELQVAS